MQNENQKLRDRATECLRRLCGRVPADRRIALIIMLFSVFALVNIWVMSTAIFNIGRESDDFERIVLPEVEVPATDTIPEPDSLQRALERFFNENFNLESDDTATE